MGTANTLFYHSLSSFNFPNHCLQPKPFSFITSKSLKFHDKCLPKSTATTKRAFFSSPLKCSYANNTPNPKTPTPQTKTVNPLFSFFPPINLSPPTPLDVCKWATIISLCISAAKTTINLLLNPFSWMYFSWTWLFWPWLLAISLAIYSLYCLHKHSQSKADIFEQFVIVTSAITWLTLVPPAHFHGYLEGWPIAFFFVYFYFFFLNVSVRKRLYGDLYPRPHEPKWDINLPNWQRLLFCALVLSGHWLAASEAPPMHVVPGGWHNVGIWVLIMAGLFMQFHSILYLAKYSEKVVVPTSVVQFGPYRWVRHPIYASTMLMMATYCVALRAPLSLVFVVGVCSVYYGKKTALEESLMIETFGERYREYAKNVRYKLIPLVY